MASANKLCNALLTTLVHSTSLPIGLNSEIPGSVAMATTPLVPIGHHEDRLHFRFADVQCLCYNGHSGPCKAILILAVGNPFECTWVKPRRHEIQPLLLISSGMLKMSMEIF